MDLIYYIVSSAVRMENVWIIVFVLAIICFVAIILKQLYLLLRPDFKIQHLKSSGLIYPSAVRFRLATVSESRSHKLDLKFDWRLRLLVRQSELSGLTPIDHNRDILSPSLRASSSCYRGCP
jgi:hypothetical protein